MPTSRNSLLQRSHRKRRNVFQYNSLCQPSGSRSLITSPVLNRMPVDRIHHPWTDRDREPGAVAGLGGNAASPEGRDAGEGHSDVASQHAAVVPETGAQSTLFLLQRLNRHNLALACSIRRPRWDVTVYLVAPLIPARSDFPTPGLGGRGDQSAARGDARSLEYDL